MTTFKSRWGYHPCSHEFYLKLKRLNLLARKCLAQAAIWERWNRKEPQNQRRLIGGKNGWENTPKKRDIPKMHRIYESIPEPTYPPPDMVTFAATIAADYKNARTPATLNDVKPLILSEEKINNLLNLLESAMATEIIEDFVVQ